MQLFRPVFSGFLKGRGHHPSSVTAAGEPVWSSLATQQRVPSRAGIKAVASAGPGRGLQQLEQWPEAEEWAVWEVLGQWAVFEEIWEP